MKLDQFFLFRLQSDQAARSFKCQVQSRAFESYQIERIKVVGSGETYLRWDEIGQ